MSGGSGRPEEGWLYPRHPARTQHLAEFRAPLTWMGLRPDRLDVAQAWCDVGAIRALRRVTIGRTNWSSSTGRYFVERHKGGAMERGVLKWPDGVGVVVEDLEA